MSYSNHSKLTHHSIENTQPTLHSACMFTSTHIICFQHHVTGWNIGAPFHFSYSDLWCVFKMNCDFSFSLFFFFPPSMSTLTDDVARPTFYLISLLCILQIVKSQRQSIWTVIYRSKVSDSSNWQQQPNNCLSNVLSLHLSVKQPWRTV